MTSSDLSHLRFFLDDLGEPVPARESDKRAVEAFGRLWQASWHRPNSERRSGQDRRKRDRRRRAVLVETDRRSGFDRRTGDRRRS